MISPTNGRIVWFTPSLLEDEHPKGGLLQYDLSKPLAAIVTHVWGDRMVNLTVCASDGSTHSFTSVSLLQDDDVAPEGGRFCEWMPFQKGQAAKVEAPAIDLDALALQVLELVKVPEAPPAPTFDLDAFEERILAKVHSRMAGAS